jgi:two-component system, NarL family, nitrate/nitrite response regulator NarL
MIAQAQVFRKQHPAARIALLQEHGQLNNANIVAALQAGAEAYFVGPSHTTLIKSLELMMQSN